MTDESKNYLSQLRQKYQGYKDNDSLMALADVESMDERVRELEIYREQEKTQELIQAAITRYRTCLEKLTNPRTAKDMNDIDRAECFTAMEWAMYTLDIVGENPNKLKGEVDKIIRGYAEKVGLVS